MAFYRRAGSDTQGGIRKSGVASPLRARMDGQRDVGRRYGRPAWGGVRCAAATCISRSHQQPDSQGRYQRDHARPLRGYHPPAAWRWAMITCTPRTTASLMAARIPRPSVAGEHRSGDGGCANRGPVALWRGNSAGTSISPMRIVCRCQCGPPTIRVAGTGSRSFGGDGAGIPRPFRQLPHRLAMGRCTSLDASNNRIRAVATDRTHHGGVEPGSPTRRPGSLGPWPRSILPMVAIDSLRQRQSPDFMVSVPRPLPGVRLRNHAAGTPVTINRLVPTPAHVDRNGPTAPSNG